MKVFILAAAVLLALQSASASDYDGSKKLICATTDAMECAAGEECIKTRVADIGAPKFLNIDFVQKTIAGPKRITPIASMEKAQDQIVLQGNELGFGWTIALDQVSGDMIVTLVNRDGAFVLFGSCTPL
jgi:hypothetical protein